MVGRPRRLLEHRGFPERRVPPGRHGQCRRGRATALPDPLAVTATFLSPPASGRAEITVAIAKRGRRVVGGRDHSPAGGRDHVRATAVLGDLDGLDGPTFDAASTSVPPFEECVSIGTGRAPGASGPPEIFRTSTSAWPPTSDGSRVSARVSRTTVEKPGSRGGRASPTDASRTPPRLMLFADAFPPAVLDLYPAGWVPTLQYSVYVRARPGPGWLQGSFRTRSMVGGLLEEDGELFDSTGRLVALSRQLALLLPAELRTTGQARMACCRGRDSAPPAARHGGPPTDSGLPEDGGRKHWPAGLGAGRGDMVGHPTPPDDPVGSGWRRIGASQHDRATAPTTTTTVPERSSPGWWWASTRDTTETTGTTPRYINQLVWNGREEETCDTTGTQEANGYTEAQFAFNVAQYLATMLRAQGATVVLTRTTNTGYGPCITQTGQHREQCRRPCGRVHPR
jgi:hypothetical protein